MFEVIFFLVICILTGIFYLVIREFYISNEYRLEEVGNANTRALSKKIKGVYIDVSCNGEEVRIFRENDNWYYKKNNKRQKIKYNEPIEIGRKEFLITKKIKKGGFLVFLPLLISLLTISFLYYQGISIINSAEENINDESDLMQVEDEINLNTQEVNNEDEENRLEDKSETVEEIRITEKSEHKTIAIDDHEDIHTIVMKYDDLFQYDVMVDWESCQESGNMRYYLVNGQSETGLNATHYQGTIDWEKVKADGVDFSLIHIGARLYGTDRNGGSEDLRLDSKCKENMGEALANNIKVGATFYSQAINKEEMDQEIEMIIQAVEGYNLDYPIGISLNREEKNRANILSDEEYIDLIKYFCIRIFEKGYTPMILGREEWFYQFPEETFEGYLKLVASKNPPSDIQNCIIWGYEENSMGAVDGVGKNLYVSLYLSGYDTVNSKANS